jgi:hypothetical protein
VLGMNDHNLPLSIYLLRPDRVQAFEEKLLGPGQLNHSLLNRLMALFSR